MYETKNLFVYGTRPELIKLWPVMDKTEDKYIVCTGQHKELLDKNLIAEPDHDMNLFKTDRRLLATMDLIMGMISWVFEWRKPERVIEIQLPLLLLLKPLSMRAIRLPILRPVCVPTIRINPFLRKCIGGLSPR